MNLYYNYQVKTKKRPAITPAFCRMGNCTPWQMERSSIKTHPVCLI